MSQDRINELVFQLESYNATYRAGNPEVSDTVYDAFTDELASLAPDHPFLTAVEPEPVDAFGKAKRVIHPSPMLSTEKAKTHEEVKKFVARIEREAHLLRIPHHSVTYRITPKLDGLAGRCENGQLFTRGNGREGYDITRAFDRGLEPMNGMQDGVGEIVIHQPYFDDVLSDNFEHPRNFMTGLVGADTLNEHAQEALANKAARFVRYDDPSLPAWEGNFKEMLDNLDVIIDDIKGRTEYLTDGVVIEIIDERLKQHLGHTSHHHRWQLALKPKSELADAIVKGVAWQVGRTGRISPVIEIESVYLSGANISRVTAHHAGAVKTQGIGAGAKIMISRSGEVIPKLEKVNEPASEVHIPDTCPCCDESLVWENDFLVCENDAACDAQAATRIQHFFKTLDAADLFGPKTCEKLVDAGKTDLLDIYNLKEGQLVAMGFGPGQAKNILRELQRSLNEAIPAWRFLAAFGIHHLGRGDSRKLIEAFETLDKVLETSESDIKSVPGFGDITSTSIAADFSQRKAHITSVMQLGFNLTYDGPKMSVAMGDNVSPIAGKKIVFTGKMAGSRDEMQEHARSLGAIPQSSVSGATDYLVCGEKVGASKITKAEKNNVVVITENEYMAMINRDLAQEAAPAV